MIPHFPEESFETLDSLIGLSFLNCDRIRGAIAAALSTWAINHKRLHFEDVSEACWEGWESPATTECENAELFITTDLSYTGGLPSNIPDFAAFVQNSKLGDSTVNPVETVLTTGTKPGFSMGLTRSQMTVSTNICWYLDTTFCYTFHWMNSGGVDVVLVMRIVVIVVCLICLFIIVGIIGAGLKNAICPKRANKAEKQVKQVFGRRSDALLYFLARAPLFTLTFSFFWLIATPIFYFFVFLPCWDCFDFKATIAHEVGHVLGFDHPDQFPSLNLRAKDGVNIGASDTCTKPLQADFIELSPLPAGSDTIMYSQTKHRSRTCLTADDVEGLNFLYPSCDDDVGGAPMAEPKCLEALELSGYLRVTLALGGPFVLAAILMAMVQCCVSCYMARRSKNYEQAVSRLRRDASGLRKEAESLRLSLRAMEERQSAGEQPAEKTKSSKIWSALAGRSSRNMMGLFTPRHGKRGGGDTSGGASGTITGNDLLNSSDSEEEMQREVERMSAVRESVREATSSRRDSQRLMV
jgi:hypothetical protein